jgi:hypothetical protein
MRLGKNFLADSKETAIPPLPISDSLIATEDGIE